MTMPILPSAKFTEFTRNRIPELNKQQSLLDSTKSYYTTLERDVGNPNDAYMSHTVNPTPLREHHQARTMSQVVPPRARSRKGIYKGSIDMLPMQQPQLAFGKSSQGGEGTSESDKMQ